MDWIDSSRLKARSKARETSLARRLSKPSHPDSRPPAAPPGRRRQPAQPPLPRPCRPPGSISALLSASASPQDAYLLNSKDQREAKPFQGPPLRTSQAPRARQTPSQDGADGAGEVTGPASIRLSCQRSPVQSSILVHPLVPAFGGPAPPKPRPRPRGWLGQDMGGARRIPRLVDPPSRHSRLG